MSTAKAVAVQGVAGKEAAERCRPYMDKARDSFLATLIALHTSNHPALLALSGSTPV